MLGCDVTSLKFVINSELIQGNMLEVIGQMRLAGKVPVVTIQEQGAKRSIPQNSLIYALYDEIAGQQEGETAQTVMRYAKLTIGVPLLRSEDEKFRNLYDKTIRMVLNYEEKLEAMDILPVSSLMKKALFTRYIDQVITHYSGIGVHIQASEYV